MRLFGWTLIAIGVLVAFGLPAISVMQPGPFSLWRMIVPMGGGALLVLVGRIVQGVGKAPPKRRGRLHGP